MLGPQGAHLQDLGAGGRLELVGGAGGDDLAVVEDDDVVGELVGLLQILGGEQHRDAVGHQPAHHAPQVGAAARVEPGGGLVEEEHLGAADQAGGQVEAAAHAAGVGLGGTPAGVGQVEALQQLARACPGVGTGHAQQAADHHQVLDAGEHLVDGGVLARQADQRAHLVCLARHVVAADAGGAGVGTQQGRQDAHRGGLARPVGAQHAQQPPLWHDKVHPVQRAGLPVALHQALGLDRIGHRSHLSVIIGPPACTAAPTLFEPQLGRRRGNLGRSPKCGRRGRPAEAPGSGPPRRSPRGPEEFLP